MASLEFLRDQMEHDLAVMDDKSKPFEVRRAARARFWHCEKRVGAMERGGFTHDEPGHHLIGYSEIGLQPNAPKTSDYSPVAALTASEARRDLADRRTAAHFAAKELL